MPSKFVGHNSSNAEREVCITFNTYFRRKEDKINYLRFYLKKLEEERQNKPKVNR